MPACQHAININPVIEIGRPKNKNRFEKNKTTLTRTPRTGRDNRTQSRETGQTREKKNSRLRRSWRREKRS